AIPGFFEPYPIDGRDYVDGGVGFSGHADLAAEAGARLVIVVNPLVPNNGKTVTPLRSRGLYSIMEQAGRIYSQNLLQLGLTTLRMKYPRTEFFLIQPSQAKTPLFGPSMGFEASRAELRFVPGVSESLIAMPTWRTRPCFGCSTSTIICRWLI